MKLLMSTEDEEKEIGPKKSLQNITVVKILFIIPKK